MTRTLHHKSAGPPAVEPESGAVSPLTIVAAVEVLLNAVVRRSDPSKLQAALSGENTLADLHRVAVRVTFQVIALAMMEARELLHPPEGQSSAGKRYGDGCALLADPDAFTPPPRPPRSGHWWRSIRFTFDCLADRCAFPDLALPGLGCSLMTREPAESRLSGIAFQLADDELTTVLRTLAPSGVGSFRHLDVGSLAAAYEQLLALAAVVEFDATGVPTVTLRAPKRSGRRSTGAFYTPDALIEMVLDDALEPVIVSRLKAAEPNARADALLAMRVCDPACGAGYFLLAAARRLAEHLVRARAAEGATVSEREALCLVLTHCMYGVDVDAMAVALTGFAFWLEQSVPGASMAPFATRVYHGNALLGATITRIGEGIPDGIFRGRRSALTLLRRNKRERADRDDCAHVVPTDGAHSRIVADAWCAAFYPEEMEDTEPITDAVLGQWCRRCPDADDPQALAVRRIAQRRRFVHWHLIFADDGCTDGAAGFDAVLGNPPFLNQLERATVTDRSSAMLISQRADNVVRGYTDLSAVFLLLGVDLLRPGGRVAMVQPQSLLAARDAGVVRRRVLERSRLCSLWVSNAHVFPGASVFTCVPVLERGTEPTSMIACRVGVTFEPRAAIDGSDPPLQESETWAFLAAEIAGVPAVRIETSGCVGDLATATADFRDQYYGLDGFLCEAHGLTAEQRGDTAQYPPVVTTGLIDPACCDWGVTPTRLLRQRWQAPCVDRRAMEQRGTLAPWMTQRLVPKILLATQTRVIEVYVDAAGRYLPGIPLITIVPFDLADLWRIAAAISSPAVSALALRLYAGAALNPDAIKLSARQVLRLPLPADRSVWDEAARSLQRAHDADDLATRGEALRSMGEYTNAAFGLNHESASALQTWWMERLAKKMTSRRR